MWILGGRNHKTLYKWMVSTRVLLQRLVAYVADIDNRLMHGISHLQEVLLLTWA